MSSHQFLRRPSGIGPVPLINLSGQSGALGQKIHAGDLMPTPKGLEYTDTDLQIICAPLMV
jgi:hypothetical protein